MVVKTILKGLISYSVSWRLVSFFPSMCLEQVIYYSCLTQLPQSNCYKYSFICSFVFDIFHPCLYSFSAKPKFDANVCTMPKVTGPCRAYFLKWYFDTSSGSCRQFVYGGCNGNGNQFQLKEDCEANCRGSKYNYCSVIDFAFYLFSM